ncbi:MAG TPA: oligoribonuclease [Lacisediminihabitans sp.]|uniref:oligoribonuclease n=1 Tax=Lacisediminihabitans sp. TaxID=2787631 RepID=UPI002ED99C20
MTDAEPTITRGDEYIVIFQGGPNDGQTDTRISTDGGFDAEITVLTAVDGKETLIDYTRASVAEVGGQYHVTYVYDPKDSEPIEAPEDRGDRQ